MQQKKNKMKQMNLFGFFTLTASMLMSADEYPAFAQSGLLAFIYLLLAGLLWFLPVALCSAEMATVEGWEEGGVFAWVRNSLGDRSGFIAVFFQWLQITVNFVTMIYFIIGALTYIVDLPIINENPLIKLIIFLAVYWIMTFFQLGGIGKTDQLVKVLFVIGIVVPSLILLILAVLYIFKTGKVEFQTDLPANINTLFHHSSLSTIVPFILAFTGIEASASYINEIKNPNRVYPMTMVLLVIFAILLDTLGGLSVATVIPKDQISMNGGVIQAVAKMISSLFGGNSNYLVKIIATLMAMGMLGEISSWIVGPVKGLLATAKIGVLPDYFSRLNKNDVPTRLVMLQGVIVSIIGTLLTLVMGGNNAAFKTAMSFTVMIYLVTYILIFLSYLHLSFKGTELKRGFRILGGKKVGIPLAIIGLLSSVVVFFSTFIPSAEVKQISTTTYVLLLISLFTAALLFAMIIYQRGTKEKNKSEKNYTIRHRYLAEANKFIHPKGHGEFIIKRNKKS